MIVWPDDSDRDGTLAAELAAKIRRRLGPVRSPSSEPPVSIVVVNRDGAEHLRRLLAGLTERTDYPRFELILVDNGSHDESLEIARDVAVPFPISIVANAHNESFSDACNQGAELASGELLVFLNNDVEPFEAGWLRELVACLETARTGLVGATLLFPKEKTARGYLVQHRAMRLLDDSVFLHADRTGHGDDPFAAGFGEDADTTIPTGACMLIERDLFERLGGFAPRYVYGGEDLDLALRVLEGGRRVLCSGRSLLIHRFAATRRKDGMDELRVVGERNRRVLWAHWGARLRREYELDLLDGRGDWASPAQEAAEPVHTREEVLALGFCLKSSESGEGELDGAPLARLRDELTERGHRCAVLRGDAAEELEAFNYDVVVHVRGPARYIPNPARLNVLWAVSDLEAVTAIECDRYELVATAEETLSARLRDEGAFARSALLDRGNLAADLVDAILVRADELQTPTRIRPPIAWVR